MSRFTDSATNPAEPTLGQLVRAYRDRAVLSQRALGELANVPRQNISAVERGSRGMAPETLARVAEALGLTGDEHTALREAAARRYVPEGLR